MAVRQVPSPTAISVSQTLSGQSDRYRCTNAFLAFNRERSRVHLNECFRQSKTEAGAFRIAKIRIGNLDERLKYPGDIIRIHADPRVFRQNNEFISLIVYDRGNENSPTFWRELNRIAQDVEQNLFQAQRIGLEIHLARRQHDCELNTFSFHSILYHLDRFINQLVQI